MAATIKDIARRTGLGLATISKYLNGGNVQPKNQQAIEEAVAALGYKVNETARSLKTRRTGYVGLVLPALNNQFMMNIVNNIQYELRQRGLGTALCCIPSGTVAERAQGEREAIAFMLQKGVDGIINLPLNEDGSHLTEVLAQNIPVTLIDKQIPELANQVNAVIVDNVAAARLATDELINAGHRRLLSLFLNRQNYTARRRYEGFCDALRERNIPEDSTEALFYNASTDEEYLAQIMEQLKRLKPTAVFASTAKLTRLAIQAINTMRLNVPQDISLIGFDGVGNEETLGIRVHSVVQPTSKIGMEAAHIMAQQITSIAQGKPLPQQVCTLYATLSRGGSLRVLQA